MARHRSLKPKIAAIAGALPSALAVRATLPDLLAELANWGLTKVPGVRASVGGMQLGIFRGRVTLLDIRVRTIDPTLPQANLRVQRLMLDVNWRSLMAGKILADVMIDRPDAVVAPALQPAPKEDEPPPAPKRRIDDKTWQDQIRDLMPFEITQILVRNGRLRAKDFPELAGVEATVDDLQIRINNLANRTGIGQALKARLDLAALLFSQGRLDLHAEGYPLADQPTANGNLQLAGLDLQALSPLVRHYLGLTVRQGKLDLFAEAAAAQGQIKGYVKPIVDHIQVEKGKKGFLQSLKAGAAKALGGIFKSRHEQRIATRVEFSGPIQEPDIGYLGAIGNFLKNAFLRAFTPRLEHSIRFLKEGSTSKDVEILIPEKKSSKAGAFMSLLKETASRWSDQQAPTLSAALSYYTVFSVAPLLLLTIAIAGLVFGRQAAQGQIVGQLSGMIGRQGAEMLQSMMRAASKPSSGIGATIIGLVTLLAGASGVMTELVQTLDQIWGVDQPSGLGATVKRYAASYGMVLAIGFVLLVSLVISAAVSAAGKFLGGMLPIPEFVMQLINLLLSFGVVTVLFALIYKVLPDAHIVWRDVWVGSAVTALLFSVGKLLIGIYLGKASVTSSYGAAGSVLVILLWVYYSAMILYFGAAFTKTYADRYGSRKASRPEIAWAPKYRAQMGDASAAPVSPKAAA